MRKNQWVDWNDVAHQLRSRTDPASEAAVTCLDAGGRWWSTLETVRVASVRRGWSRPEDDRFHPDMKIVGRDELVADLAATLHSTLEVATLDLKGPGAGAPDRFSVYLAPGTNKVVAVVGVLSPPIPPAPVYKRDEVPDTVDSAAAAFLSYHRLPQEPAPFDVTVRRELDASEAQGLYSSWPQRTFGFYGRARTITVLGAAEVTCTSITAASYAPTRRRLEGYLLILDVVPDDQGERQWHGRIDALLLTSDQGAIQLRVGMPFHYQAENRPSL
jgi:hypothetical protein